MGPVRWFNKPTRERERALQNARKRASCVCIYMVLCEVAVCVCGRFFGLCFGDFNNICTAQLCVEWKFNDAAARRKNSV